MEVGASYDVSVVRGAIDDGLAARLIEFWTAPGALSVEAARERLSEVVCVATSADGSIAAVNSAGLAEVPALDGAPMWRYRSFGPTLPAQERMEMLELAAERLERDHSDGKSRAAGLYAEIEDGELLELDRRAEWPGSGLVLAGWTPSGGQIRVRWFEGAVL